MNEVRLDLAQYDELQYSVRSKTKRIDALEHELAKVKEDYEAEIEKLTEQGKVRCISIVRHPSIPSAFLVSDEKEYKGFDDVKAEVEEHFKQGLFNEELEKYKKEQLQNLVKQLAEKNETIDELRGELSRLENRSFIERICNK